MQHGKRLQCYSHMAYSQQSEKLTVNQPIGSDFSQLADPLQPTDQQVTCISFCYPWKEMCHHIEL